MGELKIFENQEFGKIRVLGTSDSPLFCANDVTKALGYGNGRDAIAKHVEKDDVAKCDTIDNLGRTQQVTYINESGLYALIFGSKLPQAKQFKAWVTHEVLPAIRKTGSYSLVPKTYKEAIQQLLTEIEKNEALQLENQQQSEKIEADEPKVNFANAVIGSKSSCSMAELAKILTQNGYPIGQNRLYKLLRHKDYLGKGPAMYNKPYQKYVERGLFELKKGVRTGFEGELISTITTKVTEKGQYYFVNLLLHDKNTL